MNNYEQQLSIYAKQTNDALREYLRFSGKPYLQMIVIDAMRYSLLDAGKRIRAALALEFGRICNAPRKSAMAVACAVEMIHAYSLIHDDLPCMDNDDFRRGKPSCHKSFGEANALLAGDGLLSLAFETIVQSDLSDAAKVSATQTIAMASGVLGMVGGQVIDLESEGKEISLQHLNMLYSLKTGALIRAAAKLGCIAGNSDEETIKIADKYAELCGLAFQITDDILDVTGTLQTLGKPIGSDIENKKTTYVTLLGIEGAKEKAFQTIKEAKQSICSLSNNYFLNWIADMILTRDH